MKLKIFTLSALLALLAGLAVCAGNAIPRGTTVTEQVTPITMATTVAREPTAAPTEIAPKPTATPPTRPGYFSREQLIEDARQLAHVIESTHPDPYIRGGGKIAFHRRLQRFLNAIPAEGMTRDEFVRLLRPFVAAVGDAHTDIWDDYKVDDSLPGGVPLRFGIVEDTLYVAGVPHQGVDRDLIGARLVSVEGVPLAELCTRQRRLQGTENEYNVLQLLAMSSLWYKPFMQDLLPEWEDDSRVRVELQHPGQKVQEVVFPLPRNVSTLFTPESQVTLPQTDRSGFLYEFLDAERKTAYLRVEHMSYYREAYEMWAASGYRASTEATRAAIPSATETFQALVVDMKEAGTQALIVDLRGNNGGNSVLVDILLYFLYGKEGLVSLKTHSSAAGGGQGVRISDLYFENYPHVTLESMSRGRSVPLTENDYDFTFDFTDDVQRFQKLLPEAPAVLENEYRTTPTFYAEYELGTHEGYYRPENIIVLIDPGTYSSGFTMARMLDLAGAVLIGTPSAQAANSFGNAIQWRLDHTSIQGIVSCGYFVASPKDQEKGRIWPVDHPLTYEKLVAYDFDPNAEYLYALELLPELGKTARTPIAMAAEQAPRARPTAIAPTATPAIRPGYFSREQLIADARQLAHAIESAHPEPYMHGGGRIAYHRRLHRLLEAIPAEGMTRDEFIRLLRPFVAAVGDGHTDIWDDYKVDDYLPGGVPLRFGIVEDTLYVAGVPHQGVDRDLIGARLVSAEGVPLAELCARQRRLQGTENEYNVLQILAGFSLWYKPFMQDLLPEWEDDSRVRVELQHPGQKAQEVVFPLPKNVSVMFTPESQVTLPHADSSGFLYEFLDTEGEPAYLRVEHMSRYREAREMETSKPAPGLRSATETFRAMVVEMEEAGTDVLIVDLRGNQGGHSVMGDILTYFLYGKEALQDIMTHADATGGGMVRKYSDLFWSQTQSWTSLEKVNEGRALPLRADDYDFAGFSGDVEWSPARKAEAIAHSEKGWLALSPTFWEEYQSEAYSGHYCPKTVLVLTDSETFSSGFTMARYLYLAGATFVGTPSGQAANSFGNGQLWRLDHTGIEGTVSTTYSVVFPDDSDLARVLPVHYPLTYEKLAAYDFDPNAEYLYALELLAERGD